MINHTNIFCQALSIAVQYGREEAVLKLLQLGADKTLRNKAGKSPADLAVIFKRTQVPEVLLWCIPDTTYLQFGSLYYIKKLIKILSMSSYHMEIVQ